jgi:aminoglycoside 2'-N-acetyltransferase I
VADLRTLQSPELSTELRAELRALLDAAFAGDFSDHDWAHALGGWHVVAREANAIVAHASIVPRRLQVGARRVEAGYVEAVAVLPARQRHGLGTAVMTCIGDLIRRHFELGALSTGQWPFYERLGWERWRGPSSVRAADGRLVRTPDEDAGLMMLRSSATRELDITASITCEAREGDSW